MTALVALFFLLAGVGLAVMALWMVVRRGVRQLSVAGAYRDVAEQIGLQVDTRGLSVRGHLGERRIWIGEVLATEGLDRSRENRGVIAFERPLALGLHVRRRGRADRLLRFRRVADVAIGDPDLDRRLAFVADEPDRVAGLFDASSREAMRALLAKSKDLVVTDEEIQVWLPAAHDTTTELYSLVESMVRLADALESARKQIAAPKSLEPVMEGWSALGRKLGLDVDTALPALTGTVDGRRVLVAARREEEGYAAFVRVWFGPHPELGLLLRPQIEPDGYWSVGQDIQVGDPAFDAAFVVKGYDPGAVVARLGDAARAHLVKMNSEGDLVVDDRGITLSGLPVDDVGRIGTLVNEALATAAAIGW